MARYGKKSGRSVKGFKLGGRENDPNCSKKDAAKRKGKKNLKKAK